MRLGHTPLHMGEVDEMTKVSTLLLFFSRRLKPPTTTSVMAFQLQQQPRVDNGVGAPCTETRWTSPVQPQHKYACLRHQKTWIENKLPVPSTSSGFRVMTNASHAKDKL